MSDWVLVGTCGFPEAHWCVYRDLDILEVQQTLLERLRL